VTALVDDLVGRNVGAIVTIGGNFSARAAKSATSAIPIVFVTGSDPVATGLVASLARPGGNVTGVTFITTELTSKRLQLIAELVPAALVNPNNESTERTAREAEAAAGIQRRRLKILKVANESEIDAAFAALLNEGVGALLIGGDAFLNSRREQIVTLAARHAVPTIYGLREAVTTGGLVSYGPSRSAVYRQAGVYAGKILAGVKPADLPVIQPTGVELVINLKTAKALGLTVPQSLLGRADEVIE
jgi:putative ABC transport system substrate-binding protein